jgi:nucleotide-binding universal stress UspA family protein
MFRSILVPLDRSSLAEQALPLARSIAQRANGKLDLVEVHTLYALEDPSAGWLPYDRVRDAECRQQEQLYLDATAKSVGSASPLTVTAEVISGSAALAETVADSILERARIGNADLIVMTTRGRGVVSRLALGSVADQLLRRAPIPILLMRPMEGVPAITSEPVLDNILILLDGSPLAEQILEPALDVARFMEARCTLLRVVEARSSPGDRLEPPEKAQAEAYLERVAERLREQGYQVRTRVVVARHAVEAILAEAAAQASNLIALATHGRGGLNRLLLGSVADKLIRTATSPVLVYRPTENNR